MGEKIIFKILFISAKFEFFFFIVYGSFYCMFGIENFKPLSTGHVISMWQIPYVLRLQDSFPLNLRYQRYGLAILR